MPALECQSFSCAAPDHGGKGRSMRRRVRVHAGSIHMRDRYVYMSRVTGERSSRAEPLPVSLRVRVMRAAVARVRPQHSKSCEHHV